MSQLALLAAAGGTGTPVDPDPPAEMWTTGDSTGPVWVPPGALDTWRAARSSATTERVDVMLFGDSTVGYGQTIDWDPRKAPVAMYLRQHSVTDGYPDGGSGVSGISGPNPDTYVPHPLDYAPVVDVVGPTSSPTAGAILTPFVVAEAGTGYTTRGDGTEVILHSHATGAYRAQFGYSVNGGPETLVVANDTAEGLPSMHPYSVAAGLTPGRQSVRIEAKGGLPYDTTPRAITAQTGGTLTAGTYWYRVAYSNGTSETVPGPARQVTVVTGGRVAISLNASPNPAGGEAVRVYRATTEAGTYGLVHTADGNPFSNFSVYDDGTTTPGAPPQSTSTLTHGGTPSRRVQILPEFRNATGIVYQRLGVPGSGASSGVSTQTQYLLDSHRPRLVMGAWGVNNSNSDPLWMQEQTELFIQKGLDAGASVLILFPHLPPTNPNYNGIRDALRAACVAKGVGWVDLGEAGALGPADQWVSKGYTGAVQDLHLHAPGYERMAEYLWDVLGAP